MTDETKHKNEPDTPMKLPVATNRPDPSELMDSRVAEAAYMLKAMSNETRLKILCALMDGEKSVNQLSDMTGMLLPAVSQHLARLRASHLVESRREAQTIYYRCSGGVGRVLVDALCNYYDESS